METPVNNLPEDPAQARRMINLIVAAQIMGMLAFAGLAAYLAIRNPPASGQTESTQRLLLGLAGVGVAEVVAYVLVRNAMRSRWREAFAGQPNNAETMRAVHGRLFAATLLPVALAEGFGLLGAVGTLVTGQLVFLSAPALAAALMATRFVTEHAAQRLLQELTGRFG